MTASNLPKSSDVVESILWWDRLDGDTGEWMVTTTDRTGKEREYSAAICCCDPDSLDKQKVYHCESKISGPGRNVTAIGEIYAE